MVFPFTDSADKSILAYLGYPGSGYVMMNYNPDQCGRVVLQLRQFLQYSTVTYIEQFLTMLEDSMELDAFASLRQAAREVEVEVLSRLMSPNMRQ